MKQTVTQGLRRNVWALIAVVGFVAAMVLGMVGWVVYGLGFWEALYRTIRLFAMDGEADGEINAFLWVARFLAPMATVSGIVAVVFRVLYDQWVRWRATRSTRHVVVLGGGPEAADIAMRFRENEPVVCVGGVTAEEQIELRAARVRWVEAVSEGQLTQILDGCTKVIITAPDDQEASSLTSRVQGLSKELGQDPEVVTLVDSREVAMEWRYVGNDRVICRSEQVARTVLRIRAPFDENRVTPPPLVLGDGRLAAELVARIFEGWQQPGESVTVHCGGPESAWAYFVERGLGRSESEAPVARRQDGPQGLGVLVWHDLPAGTHLAVRVTEQVLSDWCASWVQYTKHNLYETGPIPVYIAFDDDAVTIPVANAVKRALGDRARVVVVPQDDRLAEHLCERIDDKGPAAGDKPEPAEERPTGQDRHVSGSEPERGVVAVGLYLQSRTAMLCAPEELDRKLTVLLAEELEAEARRWPPGVLSLYEQSDAFAVAEAIVQIAEESGFEVVSAPLPLKRVLVFNATELDTVATALDRRISATSKDPRAAGVASKMGTDGAAGSATTWERRSSLLELAGRLPALLNRAGRALVRTKGEVGLIPFDRLDHLAQLVHLGYQEVAERTSNATGSEYAVMDYELLPELVRSSNVAQVLDIPVKLALVGLRFVSASAVGQDELEAYEFQDDAVVEFLAYQEHRRWAHFQIRNGRSEHNWNKPWEVLPDKVRKYDREAVRLIPLLLREVGLVVVENPECTVPDLPTFAPAKGTFWRVGKVHAERLTAPRSWTTANDDMLQAQVGDWWVWSTDSEKSDGRSVKPDAFARTYKLIDDDLYQRTGSMYVEQVMELTKVQTAEGTACAEPHDWVVTDDDGATWTVPETAFEDLYDSAPPQDDDAVHPVCVPCGEPRRDG